LIKKTRNEIESIAKSYITKHFLFKFDDENITFRTDLFQSGLIDSFGLVELIIFIESTFQISISNEELVSSSMSSLHEIVTMIEEKLKNACK